MRATIFRRLALGCLLLSGAAANGAAQQPAAPAEETYAQQMAREQSEHPTLKIGSPAPDFNLIGIDDNDARVPLDVFHLWLVVVCRRLIAGRRRQIERERTFP